MTRRYTTDEAAEVELDRREYAAWVEAKAPCMCPDCVFVPA